MKVFGLDGRGQVALVVAWLLAGCFAGSAWAVTSADPVPAASLPAAVGAEPPTQPFLRIETGMHTAIINRVSVDASGRLAATASDDKTVRLWSLPEGRAVGTLRVPIGDGPEGALYSVALSPDGKLVAAAGHVGVLWDGQPSLYLFDVATQTIKRRLPHLRSEILHLAFSPDGRRLAAAFGGGVGVIVYDMATGRVVGEDHQFGGAPVNWVTFDADGRMAVAAFDGTVRLYDQTVTLIARQRLSGSGRPFSVAFSPDGGLLAVGSFDKPRVDVLSASDLKPRLSPDTADIRTGNLAAVAWLNDGGQVSLAAGGTASTSAGRRMIRVWGRSGLGRAADLPVAGDSINQIEPSGHGEALFVSADPSWGRINGSQVLLAVPSAIANFREIYAGRFAVSDDALTLEFGIADKGGHPMRLDLRGESYTPVQQADPTLTKPVVEVPGLRITGWQNTTAPTVNGRKLVLDGEERAHSLAIAPDGRSFLLGGDYWLRLYDARGTLLAKAALPAAAGGVVITRSGSVAVAALTDGTLRWYNLGSNGAVLEERATLFAHADGRRWVAWTPEGFFDHAEHGGKDLVGYHLNKGKAQTPEWISFAQVYLRFHSSDLLIKKILGGYDDQIARAAAAAGDLRTGPPLPGVEITDYCWKPAGGPDLCRPIGEISTRGFNRDFNRQAGAEPGPSAPGPVATGPVVTGASMLAPLTATLPADVADVTLKFLVVDRGGGVGDVAVYLNGRNIDRQDETRAFRRDASVGAGPAAVAAGPPSVPGRPVAPPLPSPSPSPSPAGQVFQRSVALASGVNRTEIRVYEGSDTAFATSRPVELVRAAAAPSTRDLQAQPPATPRLFVLAAGVDIYKRPEFRLNFPVADAEGVAETLKAHVGDLYEQVLVPSVTPDRDVVFVPFTGGKAALANENASLEMLGKAFAALSRDQVLHANDTVVIYLAGHGTREDDGGGKGQAGGKFYFITSNVDSPDTVRTQALGQDALLAQLVAINSRKAHILLVLDTCHSGAFAREAPLDAIANLNDEAGISVLAAAASNQEALDGYRPRTGGPAQHGVFAYAVISGLAGAATADETGIIYPTFLAQYVKHAVVALAAEVSPTHQQQAKWQPLGEEEDFPLVRKSR